MNNSELLEDMKQMLRAELSASEGRTAELVAGLATKEDVQRLENRIDVVEQHMVTKEDLQETQDAIAETLTTALDSVASKEQVRDHERRITRLQNRAA